VGRGPGAKGVRVGQTIVFCRLSATPCSRKSLTRRARPLPLLLGSNQSRLDWVFFHIADQIPQFFRRPNPTVERFVLPERSLRPPQQAIRHPGGSALKPAHNSGHRADWVENRVYVVWHNDPCAELAPRPIAVQESARDHLGDLRVAQPERAGISGTDDRILSSVWRGRSGQPPCHKNCRLFRYPVR